MTPEGAQLLRFVVLGVTALVVMAVGYGVIWMVRRSRNVSRRRARKDKAARRRVDAAIERHELGQSSLTVPDRFEALVADLAAQYAPDGFVVELTGPWPAYNFVDLELSAGEAPRA